MDQRGEAEQQMGPAGRREGRGFALVIVACVVVIAGLALVAQGGESAGGPGPVRVPTPALTTSEACETWARYWMDESGVGASAESLEAFSNCHQGEDGSWFVPFGRGDPRLTGPPILSVDERAQTDAAREVLLGQIAALEREFQDGLEDQLAAIYSRVPEPVVGHIKDRDGIIISPARGRYTRLTQAFLMDPRYEALAKYVGWLMAERAEGFEAFQAKCHRPELAYLWAACDGIGNSLSVYYPPWPWELKDTFNLDRYLDWAVANDALPTAPTPATPAPFASPF